MTVSHGQRRKAATFRSLHDSGVFALPNAWDAGSAVLIAEAGAQAIATTSAGVSWSLGRPDGQNLTQQEMTSAVARITAAVDLPAPRRHQGGCLTDVHGRDRRGSADQ